jgi:hypothetical protein
MPRPLLLAPHSFPHSSCIPHSTDVIASGREKTCSACSHERKSKAVARALDTGVPNCFFYERGTGYSALTGEEREAGSEVIVTLWMVIREPGVVEDVEDVVWLRRTGSLPIELP